MRLGLILLLLLSALPARADRILVAVAANFAEAAEALEPVFEAQSGDDVQFAVGSTGKLYAQIKAGAPFDVLLSADEARPALLVQEGLGLVDTLAPYAVGRLVLWSADPEAIGADGLSVLQAGAFRHLAIANPDLAPYGLAAKQALQGFGLWDALQGKIVMGQNVGQAFSLVATGNAELGLIAASSALSPRNGQVGSLWAVPAQAHDPIRQGMVQLRHGADNPAAARFVAFMASDAARAVMARFGYGAP